MAGIGLNSAFIANSYNNGTTGYYNNGAYSSQYSIGTTPYQQYQQQTQQADQQQAQITQQQQQTAQQLLASMLQMMLALITAVLQKAMNIPAYQAPVAIKPDFNSNESIQGRMNQLVPPGTDSFLDQQVANLSRLEPESPEAQQTQARIAARWTQLGRSDKDLQELFILQAVRSLNNVTGNLNRIGGSLTQGSPESQQLAARIGAIGSVKMSLIQQYNKLAG